MLRPNEICVAQLVILFALCVRLLVLGSVVRTPLLAYLPSSVCSTYCCCPFVCHTHTHTHARVFTYHSYLSTLSHLNGAALYHDHYVIFRQNLHAVRRSLCHVRTRRQQSAFILCAVRTELVRDCRRPPRCKALLIDGCP